MPPYAFTLAQVPVFTEARAVEYGRRIGGALAAIHATGCVHGDCKPSHCFLDASGNCCLRDLGGVTAIGTAARDTSPAWLPTDRRAALLESVSPTLDHLMLASMLAHGVGALERDDHYATDDTRSKIQQQRPWGLGVPGPFDMSDLERAVDRVEDPELKGLLKGLISGI